MNLTDHDLTYWGFIIGVISFGIGIIGFIMTIVVYYKTKNIAYILSRKSDIIRYNNIRKNLLTSFESQISIIEQEQKVTFDNRNDIIKCYTKLKSLKCIRKNGRKAITAIDKEIKKTNGNENIEIITQNLSILIAELDREIEVEYEYK